MPRSFSSAIQSDVACRAALRDFTEPAIWIAPPNSSSFSVSVVLPASGCEMIAKVRRRRVSLRWSDMQGGCQGQKAVDCSGDVQVAASPALRVWSRRGPRTFIVAQRWLRSMSWRDSLSNWLPVGMVSRRCHFSPAFHANNRIYYSMHCHFRVSVAALSATLMAVARQRLLLPGAICPGQTRVNSAARSNR